MGGSNLIVPGHGVRRVESFQRKAQAGVIDNDIIPYFLSNAADHDLCPGNNPRSNRRQGLVDVRMSPHVPVKASEAEISSNSLPISDD
jgi:hypothetical protein